jgi:hypothetical protein
MKTANNILKGIIAAWVCLLITDTSMGTTITAQDIIDEAGTTGDFGTNSITIGDFTIATIESVNLASGINGEGTPAIGTTTDDDNQFEGASGLSVSFASPVNITSLTFGLHGTSDGNLIISGFASDPNASSTSGTPSFSVDTLTIVPAVFSHSYVITLATPVDVSSLDFTTSTTANNGIGFLGIAYDVAPPSAPTAIDDTVSTSYETATNIFVLVNDIGADLGIESVDATATNASGQVKGSVAYTPGNDFVTCTPSNGFSGDLYFSYVVTNSVGSATGLVTVAVAVDPSTVILILADDFTGVSKAGNVATITAWDTADGITVGTTLTALNDGGTAANYFDVNAGELDPNATVWDSPAGDGWNVYFSVTLDARTASIDLTILDLTSWSINDGGVHRNNSGAHTWTLTIVGDEAYGTQSASGDATYGGAKSASATIDLSGMGNLVADENYTFKLRVTKKDGDSTYATLDNVSMSGVITIKKFGTVFRFQ